MAEESSETRRPIHARFAAWLCEIVASKGWPRRLLLAAAVVVFLVVLAIVRSGVDYRNDPSALVPRSAALYVETRDLELLLKNIGSWPLWDVGFRSLSDGKRSQMQEVLAGKLGRLVTGLGAQLPLLWTSGGDKAAALAVGDGEKAGEKAWALYLNVTDPNAAVADLRVEPSLKLEAVKGERDGLYTLGGDGGTELFLAALRPWLIISSDKLLPTFALESARRPGGSLAYSEILPPWHRSASVRGVADPVYLTSRPDVQPLFGLIGGWLDAKARLAFSARIDAAGNMNTDVAAKAISGQIRGGGVWPLVKFLLYLLGIACLVLILAILVAIIGWTGWLKALAVKAGARPKSERTATEPSPAFNEDAGAPAPATPPTEEASTSPSSPESDAITETEPLDETKRDSSST